MLLCRSSRRPQESLKDQNSSTEAETARGASDFGFWPQLQHGPGLSSHAGGLPEGLLDAETPKWAANAALHQQQQQSAPEATGRRAPTETAMREGATAGLSSHAGGLPEGLLDAETPKWAANAAFHQQQQQSAPEATGRRAPTETAMWEGATAGSQAGDAASHPEADAELLAGSRVAQPQPERPAAASAAGPQPQQALQDSSATLDACLGRLLQRVQARHAAVMQQQRGGLWSVPASSQLMQTKPSKESSSNLMQTSAVQESSSLKLARAAADQELELLVAAAQQRRPWTSKPAPGDQQSQLVAVPSRKSAAQLDANPGGRRHHSSKHRLQLADAAWAGQVAHLRELWLDIQKVTLLAA